jgi:phage terminase large subunit
LDLRLRGVNRNYYQIIASFNPVSSKKAVVDMFVSSGAPDDAEVLKTTYLDNHFLDDHYRKVLESLKEQDFNLWKIYARGEVGLLTNQVYPNPYNFVDAFPPDEYFDDVIYGLDFGFKNPSALIKIGIKDQDLYLQELLYESELTNTELIKKVKQLIGPFDRNRSIYADSAEPDRIEEFEQAGFNVYPAYKGSIVDGVDWVKKYRCYVDKESENLIKEKENYTWKMDKDGNPVEPNVPVKFLDHLMDAKRYAIHTHFKEYGESVINIETGEIY